VENPPGAAFVVIEAQVGLIALEKNCSMGRSHGSTARNAAGRFGLNHAK